MAKKIGYFFYSFLPLLLVIGIEYAATCFLLGMMCLVELLATSNNSSIDAGSVFTDVMNQLTNVRFSTYTMVLYSLISICTFGIWYVVKFNGRLRPDFKQNFHPKTVLGIILLTPGAQCVCTYLVAILATLFPSWMETYQKLLENAGMDDTLTFGLFLYSVLLAPICEELLCRGVILKSIRRCFPFWAANLFQAVLFGVLHMNMIQGVYAFCLGLILGFIYEKTGSIYYSILLHIMFNFWGTVIGQLLDFSSSIPLYLLSSVIYLVLFVIGACFVFAPKKNS